MFFISAILSVIIWPVYWIFTGKDFVELTLKYFDKKLKPEEAEDE